MKEKEKERLYEPDDPQEETIRRLMKLSGGRSAISEEVTSRVREAVHAHWKEGVRARSRKKMIWLLAGSIAASLLVVLTAWYFDDFSFLESSPVAVVENITGQVVVGNDQLLAREAVISADSVLESGDTGRVLLRTMEGVLLRLDVHTRMRLESGSAFVLERGAMYLDSGPSHRKFHVSTPLGEVANHGTQFEVRLNDRGMEVRVREGAVSLTNEDDSHEIKGGNRLIIDTDGKTELSPFPSFGPDWAWLSSVSPIFHLEGNTLSEFLTWVTHENGWALSQSRIQNSHGNIVLHGSIENLSPDQMLDAVLPVCGLSYNLQDGVLTVSPTEIK
jgi:hypothetical protein